MKTLWVKYFWMLLAPGASTGTVDRNVEGRLTIAGGVYGQTTAHDDVGINPVEYFPMTLKVTSRRTAVVVAAVTSDAVGFYQMALSPGKYGICTSFGRCTEFAVAPGKCVRLDYEFSLGVGWSKKTTTPCGR